MDVEHYLSTHLKEGERLIRTVRQHPAVILPAAVGGGLLMLVNFFLLAWWFGHHGWGALGFTIVFALNALWIIRSIYLWRNNILFVTTARVIDLDQRGFFERRVIETPFDKVQDIRYSVRGLWPTIFRFGTISLFTAGASEPLDLDFVARPAELHQQLADIQQHKVPSTGPLSAEELVAMVDQLKSSLPPEKLDQLFRRPSRDHGSKRPS